MSAKRLSRKDVGYHDPRGKFALGNPGGVKGSGRHSIALALRCEHLVATEVLPTIEKYLRKVGKTPNACKDRGYQWAAQYLRDLLPKTIEHAGEVDLNVRDAQATFTSRITRLTERLGSAAMPEGIE